MPDSELDKELFALRARIDALCADSISAQSDDGLKRDTAGGERDLLSDAMEGARKMADTLEFPEAKEQVAAFLKMLGNDVRDSKPSALAASFAAGVLVGKLISK